MKLVNGCENNVSVALLSATLIASMLTSLQSEVPPPPQPVTFAPYEVLVEPTSSSTFPPFGFSHFRSYGTVGVFDGDGDGLDAILEDGSHLRLSRGDVTPLGVASAKLLFFHNPTSSLFLSRGSSFDAERIAYLSPEGTASETSVTASSGGLHMFFGLLRNGHAEASLFSTDGTAEGSLFPTTSLIALGGGITRVTQFVGNLGLDAVYNGFKPETGSALYMQSSIGGSVVHLADPDPTNAEWLARVHGSIGSRILFSTIGGTQNNTLYSISGATNGTIQLSQTGAWRNTGRASFLDEKLIFVQDIPGEGPSVWSTSGASEATIRLDDVAPGNPAHFVVHDGRVWYLSSDLMAIRSVSAGGGDARNELERETLLHGLSRLGGRLYFLEGPEQQLFTSDGTPGGTLPVGFPDGFTPSRVEFFGATDSQLLVATAATASIMNALWRIGLDGGEPIQIESYNRRWNIGASGPLQRIGDEFIFSVPGTGARSTVISDGTPAGTRPLRGELSFLDEGDALYPSASNGLTLFTPVRPASSATYELRRHRPGEPGAETLATFDQEFRVGTVSRIGDATYLSVTEFDLATLLRVDDSSVEAVPIVAHSFSANSRLPAERIESASGLIWFTSWNGIEESVWASDGTPEGTEQILPPRNPNRNFAAGPFHETLHGVIFRGRTDSAREDLYISDGTEAGTRSLLSGILPSGFIDGNTVLIDGRVLFSRRDNDGTRLRWADGKEVGSVDFGSEVPSAFTILGTWEGRGVIRAVLDRETRVFLTDSHTAWPLPRAIGAGTSSFLSSYEVPTNVSLSMVALPGGRGFITAGDAPGFGIEPIHGFSNGTRPLVDVHTGGGYSMPRDFLLLEDKLVFIADTALQEGQVVSMSLDEIGLPTHGVGWQLE